MSVSGSPAINVVAVTGCDGSGKSTLTASLLEKLGSEHRVAWVYLGQSSGRIKEWIDELPLVGPRLARYLEGRSAKIHADSTATVGAAEAVVIYLLSLWRVHKFRRVLRLSERGVLVVTDRYPQAEVPGFHFDGPELAVKLPRNAFVRRLADSERRLYEWMAGYRPALIVRLNVDLETAHRRKPDHQRAALRKKVETLPALRFNGARVVDLDGHAPAGEVVAAALQAIEAATRIPRA